jgi:hypothetical protein
MIENDQIIPRKIISDELRRSKLLSKTIEISFTFGKQVWSTWVIIENLF